ncbi:MAG: undecaprenyl-diphosphate phosphatase [Bacteroidales bacterium]|nr:undecaprenyl-diphosphate phosphatase [Bacteroidales bacterium]
MTALDSILLGLVQGLTEFLPVSSSGHLTIGKEVLGVTTPDLSFEIVVHAATVLSTLVVFRKEIIRLISGIFKFRMNSETDYIFKIVVSMIPVMLVGLLFKDKIEAIFGSGLMVVGISLIATAVLLSVSNYAKPKERELSYMSAFIIGVAQAVAVLPGLSRSGSTIATGMILGVKKDQIAKFSFLMVLVPILGEAFLDLVSGGFATSQSGLDPLSLVLGFISAFVSGLLACRVMIALVKRSKLLGFAVYCALLGAGCVIYSQII